MTNEQLSTAIITELKKINVTVWDDGLEEPAYQPSPLGNGGGWIFAHDCEHGTKLEVLAHEATHAIQAYMQKDRIARPLGQVFRSASGVLRYATHIKFLRENYPNSGVYKYYLDCRDLEVEAFSMMDRPELVYQMLLLING